MCRVGKIKIIHSSSQQELGGKTYFPPKVRKIDLISKFQESKGKSSSLSNLGLMFKKSSPITQVKTKKVIGNNDLFGVDIKLLVQQFCLIEQVQINHYIVTSFYNVSCLKDSNTDNTLPSC